MKMLKSLITLVALCVLSVNCQSTTNATPDPSTVYNSFQISGGTTSNNGICDPSGNNNVDATINVPVNNCTLGCGGNVKIVQNGNNVNEFIFRRYSDATCSTSVDGDLPFKCSDSNKNAIPGSGSSFFVRCGTGDGNNPTVSPTPTQSQTSTPSPTPTQTPSATPTPTPAPTTQPPATTQPPVTETPQGNNAAVVSTSLGLIFFTAITSLLSL